MYTVKYRHRAQRWLGGGADVRKMLGSRALPGFAAAMVLAAACTPARRSEAARAPVGPVAPGATAPASPPGFERRPDETASVSDLGGDGRPDVWTYAAPGAGGTPVVIRRERDANGDGRVDTWERFGPDGASVVEAAFDLDFDGGADVRLAYDEGRLVRTELAPRPDGVPRTWSHFEGGKLIRKERDADGDGKADGWIHWHGGELDRIGVDLDGDGRADRWEVRPSPSRDDQK